MDHTHRRKRVHILPIRSRNAFNTEARENAEDLLVVPQFGHGWSHRLPAPKTGGSPRTFSVDGLLPTIQEAVPSHLVRNGHISNLLGVIPGNAGRFGPGKSGWGGRIRTYTIRINSAVSYRLDHAPVVGHITIQRER